MENTNTFFEVKQNHQNWYIVKCDGTKFEYECKKYKYWCRRRFKQQDAKATCSFLNGLSKIKKTKKKNYDIFGYQKQSKRIQNVAIPKEKNS